MIIQPTSRGFFLPTADMVNHSDPRVRASQVQNLRNSLEWVATLLRTVEGTGNLLELGDTVVTEQSFGQAPYAGVGSDASRVDHTHGTPSVGNVAELDFYTEEPVGVINGLNTTFTVSIAPVYVVLLTIRGLIMHDPLDYSLAGNTITYVIAPFATSTRHRMAFFA